MKFLIGFLGVAAVATCPLLGDVMTYFNSEGGESASMAFNSFDVINVVEPVHT